MDTTEQAVNAAALEICDYCGIDQNDSEKVAAIIEKHVGSPVGDAARCKCGAPENDPIHSISTEFSQSHAFAHCAASTQYAAAETGWLLEKSEGGEIWYITVDQLLTWTTDPLKALRLARREDAELLCEIVEDCERVAEHQWG